MASKPLGIEKKDQLQAQLAERKSISSQDKNWLDQEANFVDEEQIMSVLEEASDHERGLEGLNDAQKGVVRRLREAAGDIAKVVGKKQKRVCSYDSWLAALT